MKLGTKKLLSLALTGALVLGGANVSGTVKTASADEPAASADVTASPAATTEASAPAATAEASASPAATPAATADASATPVATADASATPAATADASASPAATADASAAPSAAPSEAPATVVLPYGVVGEEGEDISTEFVANIDSWGTVIADWGVPENPESKLTVKKTGKYQISTVATADIDDLKSTNAFDLGLNLTAAPDGFDVVGESVTIAGTEYALDQEFARLYLDDKSWRVGISNVWNENPWANTFTTADAIQVNEGDVVTITFKVVKGDYAHFGEEVAPVSTKNACKKVTAPKKAASIKRGKSKTITFTLKNATASKKTTDKITVKSSNKKVTATVVKKKVTAKKVVVKVKVGKKAKKNSTVKITLKVGKKSATAKIKVK